MTHLSNGVSVVIYKAEMSISLCCRGNPAWLPWFNIDAWAATWGRPYSFVSRWLNRTTTLSCPRRVASSAGVRPVLSFTVTSAPLARSSSTISLWPRRAALCRGESPFVSRTLMLDPLAKSSSTTSLCPRDAKCSGVRPLTSLAH